MEVQNKLSFDFIPLEQMLRRAKASKDESDTAYFYDLMTIGEMVTKFATLFLVANIEDDVDRTRYRYEYRLVRADGIGVYADIITDIEMPLMDGHRLCKLVKENDTLKNIPVIIFSSLINDEIRRKGESLGADAQLTKPEIGKLIAVVDELVAKYEDARKGK